jgi:uncharacterized protein
VSTYWPWWLGALALGGLTPFVFVATGRMLGVSGFWSRALSRREQIEVAKAHALSLDAVKMEQALLEATIAQFGPDAAQLVATAPPTENHDRAWKAPPPLAWSANLTFLVCLAAGGGLASFLRGGWSISTSIEPELRSVAGAAWPFFLLGGGFLVGFGTRMAGGCTSGHGLSGCSTFQRGSLIATAVFFLAGVVVSLLLGAA